MSRATESSRRTVLIGAAVAAATVLGVGRAAGEPPRYHGYSDNDRAQPYARFMAESTRPAPAVVTDAYNRAPIAAESVPSWAQAPQDLGSSGYSPVETGYGRDPSGMVWVAVHTVMPGVTAAMWDWWFGWHSVESARYKLWHPDAHLYADAAEDRTARPISDRDKYVGNISYVDEYIGTELQQLAIAFHDPRRYGFDVPSDQTLVLGRVGSSVAPLNLGWLAHQVRPIVGGSEMRSRFYLNLAELRLPDLGKAARAVERGVALDPADAITDLDTARELLVHCGQEMNHLAHFLPELHREFG